MSSRSGRMPRALPSRLARMKSTVFIGDLHPMRAEMIWHQFPMSRLRLRRVATRAGVLRKWLVFVVAAKPDACLVAPLGGAVEPLVHAPEAVQTARIGGIRVVDDAVLEHERAHSWP